MGGLSSMDTTDRISQLPEPILEHILSLLLIKDVARMSTLSKTLNNAWSTHSYLNYGDNFFHNLEDIKSLVNVVHRTLAYRKKHKIPVHKFWLMLPYWPSRSKCVPNWIKMLVACNIQEVNLKPNRPFIEGEQPYNTLPEVIFEAKVLKVLNLSGFKIELPSNGIKFSSLRELHLKDVFLDEKFIQGLCRSCHNLEVLYLQSFDGLTSFQVGENLSKLKKVTLEFCPCEFQMVDIAAYNLEELKIYCAGLEVVKITACKALKSLSLNGVAVTDKWFEQLFSSLQNLEKFSIFCCKTLKTMKISGYRLKQLTVCNCPNLVDAQVYTPNLIRFNYTCYSLPTLKLKASALLEAHIFFYTLEIPGSDWYSKLTNFLGNFNHTIAIELSSEIDEVIVIPKDMRINLFPPLHSTNNLHVKIQKRLTYSSVDVVDSLLWISSQLDSVSFRETLDLKTLKFIYNDASNEDEKPCCTSLPWKCWRHKFKQVKMQNFSCTEQQELRDYFSKTADISQIIDVPPECC